MRGRGGLLRVCSQCAGRWRCQLRVELNQFDFIPQLDNVSATSRFSAAAGQQHIVDILQRLIADQG